MAAQTYYVDVIFVEYRWLLLSQRIYQYFAFDSNVTEVESSHARAVHAAKPKLPTSLRTLLLHCHFGRFEFARILFYPHFYSIFILFAFSAPSSLAAPNYCSSPCVSEIRVDSLNHLQKNCTTVMTSRVSHKRSDHFHFTFDSLDFFRGCFLFAILSASSDYIAVLT